MNLTGRAGYAASAAVPLGTCAAQTAANAAMATRCTRALRPIPNGVIASSAREHTNKAAHDWLRRSPVHLAGESRRTVATLCAAGLKTHPGPDRQADTAQEGPN